MTVTTAQDTFADLAFARGVERELVHRTAIAEVFATDLVRVGDADFVAGAQLPRTHHYYGDHAGTDPAVDCLLLQECCRQVSTLLVHRHFDVPLRTAFLVTRWRMRLDRQVRLDGGAPAELAMAVRVSDAKLRADRLAALSLAFDLRLGGERIGGMDIGAAYLPPEHYAVLRSARRDSPPPSSDRRPHRGGGVPAEPAAVGRRDAANVVLADLGDRRAVLDVPTTHPSLYDHPLDHVPAMALLEAARQLTVATTGRQPSTVDARFDRFVELDSPAEVTAEPDGDGLLVRVVQDGTPSCTVAVTA